jgi:signal transduction histidine kinase
MMRASEMHFHRLANSVAQLVWVVDAAGRISYGNSNWYSHTGIGAGAKFVRNYLPLLHPDDRLSWERTWGHALASGEAYALECRLRFTAGSKYVQHLEWGHPVRDNDGKNPEWIVVATDADEDRRLIAELRRTIARKDQFLALVAHELRGPIAPILTTLQLLARHVEEPRLVEQSCARMARQFAQLKRLVEDLFDLARSQNAQMLLTRGNVELEAAVEAAIENAQPLIASRRHHLSVVTPSQTTVVNGDAGRLTQVFANLLVNAAKFTGEAGRICVLIEREPGWVLVKVRDSGIGISPDMLERVFDAYMQAERESAGAASGLGLGLALARRLIELHGGTVNAYSEGLGRGSEFVVRLPAGSGRESPESRAQECNSFAIT